jgi:hypothetical protein
MPGAAGPETDVDRSRRAWRADASRGASSTQTSRSWTSQTAAATPALATLDLSVQRPFKVHGVKTRVGMRVFNALNRFNPRDVMNDVASPAFGNSYNPIPRSFGLNFWIDR